jgi:hypothetical protein
MRHETVNKVTIERFPLGAVAGVDAVLQLLGAHGFANREPAIAVAPMETPALPAPAVPALPHVCPECGRGFAKTTGLGSHRKTCMGSPGKVGGSPHLVTLRAPTARRRSRSNARWACTACASTVCTGSHVVRQSPVSMPVPTCEARFETPMALDMHQMKVHRLPPPTAFAVVAAVAAPDDSRNS